VNRRLRQLLCALAAVAALAAAGCGGDDEPEGELLPSETSQSLLAQLDSVGDRVASGFAGACDDIYAPEDEGGNIAAIDAELAAIPSDVDPEIRSALEQSVERLTQLVDSECDAIRDAEQDEQEVLPEEEEPVETAPEETETTPTETTPTPPPTETEAQPPATPAPPAGGGGGGDRNGGGPGGDGPPGQDRGGAEAPDEDDG
jgi:hypothetical protein